MGIHLIKSLAALGFVNRTPGQIKMSKLIADTLVLLGRYSSVVTKGSGETRAVGVSNRKSDFSYRRAGFAEQSGS
jgi:hypothetical protein